MMPRSRAYWLRSEHRMVPAGVWLGAYRQDDAAPAATARGIVAIRINHWQGKNDFTGRGSDEGSSPAPNRCTAWDRDHADDRLSFLLRPSLLPHHPGRL